MQSDEVLAWLEQHPDFLKRYADQLGLRNKDRVVVPLAERQLLEARDQNRQLEARLAQLMRHGEANDLTIARTHKLALEMLRPHTLASLAAALRLCFEGEFGLNRCALKLWHPKAETESTLYTARADTIQLARNLSTPYCGPYVNDEVLGWFPATPVLQSFAQVPLRETGQEPFGLLVLASDDAERFTYNMHTQYLARIGELVSTGLARILAA
jgi:uncharacterized protein YigA (DUF484 family)